MGNYKRLGIRFLALNVIEIITCVREFGLVSGISTFISLKKRKGDYFVIKNQYFKHPIFLRNNYSDKAIFSQIFFEKQYKIDAILKLRPKHIIDAGSNIGLSAIFFKKLYPEAQIICIEPEANNFKLLVRNTENLTSVTCIEAALWFKDEKIKINNPESLSASFIVEPTNNGSIKTITIDEIISRYDLNEIDILKMDIEGAEKEIFLNKINWINKVKLLIIELHDNYINNSTKVFFKAIEHLNYKAFFYNENIFIFFQ